MRNTVKRFSGSEGSFLSGSDMCKVIFLITNKYLRENVAHAALVLLPLHLLRVWKHTWAGVRLQSWWETTQEAWNCKWEIRMKNKTKQRTWWVVSPFSDLLGDWVSSSPFLSPVFTVLILKKGQEARRGSWVGCLPGLVWGGLPVDFLFENEGASLHTRDLPLGCWDADGGDAGPRKCPQKPETTAAQAGRGTARTPLPWAGEGFSPPFSSP